MLRVIGKLNLRMCWFVKLYGENFFGFVVVEFGFIVFVFLIMFIGIFEIF